MNLEQINDRLVADEGEVLCSETPRGTMTNWFSRDRIAWAAGLFEGEGCIHLAKGRTPLLTLSMTDEDVVRRFQATLKCGFVAGPMQRNPKHRPQWRWSANKHEYVQAILAMFWPWLGKRRRQRVIDALGAFNNGWRRGENNASKTHCKQGHKFTVENTRIRGTGRRCKTCERQWIRRWWEKHPDLVSHYKRMSRAAQHRRGSIENPEGR